MARRYTPIGAWIHRCGDQGAAVVSRPHEVELDCVMPPGVVAVAATVASRFVLPARHRLAMFAPPGIGQDPALQQ